MTGAPAFPGALLPSLARAAIGAKLGLAPPMNRVGLPRQWLEPGASFVTLRLESELRGCVGSLVAAAPLIDDVEANARAAAFDDPRFAPLGRGELARLAIEVSVLGPLERLVARCEEELLEQLVPHRDGVVLAVDGQRATFLPQVWASLPEPRRFLEQLRRKAGVRSDFWDLAPELFRYRVTKWSDPPAPVGAEVDPPARA